MATQVLVPNSDYYVVDYLKYPATANYYEKIDDGISRDGSYVYVVGVLGAPLLSLFDVTAPTAIGSIQSVQVVAVMRCTSGGDCAGMPVISLNRGSTMYGSNNDILTSSYTVTSQTWNTNPATSAAWGWSDLDNILAGVYLDSSTSGKWAVCTSLYLVITHTIPSSGGAQIIGLELL